MSWLSKLGSGILHGLGVVAKVVTSPAATALEQSIPFVGTFMSLVNPSLAAIIAKGSAIVNGVEGLITTAQSGVVKKETAVQIAMSELPGLQELIAEFGSGAKIPPAELGTFLDSIVAVYNNGHALVTAIGVANGKPATPAA